MNNFEKLNAVNVSEHIEKKGQFKYLSWTWAIEQLSNIHPEAEIHTKVDDNGFPAFYSRKGDAMVWVTVTIDNVVRGQPYPVLDHRNKSVTDPDVFTINTSLQRALVKAISLHGLGLYIYAGEDLPVTPPKPATKKTIGILTLASDSGSTAFREAWKAISKTERERVTQEQLESLKNNCESADYQSCANKTAEAEENELS